MTNQNRITSTSFSGGDANPATKLTPRTVRLIRAWARLGFKSPYIGPRFGVDSTTALRVINRKTWKEIE